MIISRKQKTLKNRICGITKKSQSKIKTKISKEKKIVKIVNFNFSLQEIVFVYKCNKEKQTAAILVIS